MSKWLGFVAALAMVMALGACQQEQTATGDDSKPVVVQEQAAAEEPAPAVVAPVVEEEAVEEAAEPAAEEVAVDGAAAVATDAAAGLVGPQWKLDEYVATFNADNTMSIKVGEMSIDGQYELKENDVIEISAMGTILSGTWDGESLTINGDTVEKIVQ